MLPLAKLILAPCLLLTPPPPGDAPSPSDPPVVREADSAVDESSLAHLPDSVRHDIEAWRRRLLQARCLKVVCETEETWANLHELEEDGSPRVVLRERFAVHAWMTPDSVWAVIFPYQGDTVDTSRPVFQQYWSAQRGMAWERVWVPKSASYRVRRYECDDPSGPSDPRFGSQGCIFASATQSWLAGPADLSKRAVSVASISLLRRPNLAMVPPAPDQPGIWLDVFRETVPRDDDDSPESLYRRHDFMLLARNDKGEPELREWRTLVLTDPSAGGKEPQQITGIRRLSYVFYDTEPAELKSATTTFVGDVDRAVVK